MVLVMIVVLLLVLVVLLKTEKYDAYQKELNPKKSILDMDHGLCRVFGPYSMGK